MDSRLGFSWLPTYFNYECGMSTAQAGCFINDGMGGGLCGLLCTVSDGADACPTGMGCQDLMDGDYPDTGFCTWPQG